MKILHVRLFELTHTLSVRCSFWRSLPFIACFGLALPSLLFGLLEDRVLYGLRTTYIRLVNLISLMSLS